MKAHVLQHVAFEGLGSIEGWLDRRRATVAWTQLHDDPATLPRQAAGLDLVIALGGPMSVNDEAGLPWLVGEKRFLREAIDAGVAVLGICLGAQLMASACGAAVHPGRQKEIGWFPVEAVATPAAPSWFAFPPSTLAFHWHGETFDLPAGAVHLARSAACERQAFQLGASAIGLQFHLETTPPSAASLIEHCGHELTPDAWVQSPDELLRAPAAAYEATHRLMDRVLDHLTAQRPG